MDIPRIYVWKYLDKTKTRCGKIGRQADTPYHTHRERGRECFCPDMLVPGEVGSRIKSLGPMLPGVPDHNTRYSTKQIHYRRRAQSYLAQEKWFQAAPTVGCVGFE